MEIGKAPRRLGGSGVTGLAAGPGHDGDPSSYQAGEPRRQPSRPQGATQPRRRWHRCHPGRGDAAPTRTSPPGGIEPLIPNPSPAREQIGSMTFFRHQREARSPPAFLSPTSRHGRPSPPQSLPSALYSLTLTSFLFVPGSLCTGCRHVRLVSALHLASLRPALATLPLSHSSCYGTIAADYTK